MSRRAVNQSSTTSLRQQQQQQQQQQLSWLRHIQGSTKANGRYGERRPRPRTASSTLNPEPLPAEPVELKQSCHNFLARPRAPLVNPFKRPQNFRWQAPVGLQLLLRLLTATASCTTSCKWHKPCSRAATPETGNGNKIISKQAAA
jgi:hypothetical protein